MKYQEQQRSQRDLMAQEGRIRQEEQQRAQRDLRTQEEKIRQEEQQRAQKDLRAQEGMIRQEEQQRLQGELRAQGVRIRQEERQRLQGELRTQEERMRQEIRTEEQRHAEEQLRLREGNLRKGIWDELWESMQAYTDTPTQEAQQHAGDQQSREELRVQDESLPSVQRMQEQLQGELRGQEESRARVRQLREQIQRELWGQEDLPRDERLNELLQQKIWNVVSDHRLDEVLFPRQQHGELPNLRQRLQNLYLQTVSEYTSQGLPQGQIAGEFVDQLQEQMEEHNRPSQEWIDASEDIQELLTGRRPDRTRP